MKEPPSAETAPALEQVAGRVCGVRLSGLLPAGFRGYLNRDAAPASAAGESLELRVVEGDGPPPGEVVWASGADEGSGLEEVVVTRQAEGFRVRVGERGGFSCAARTAEIRWKSDAEAAAHFFFTLAFPLWLESRGVVVLHASAVSLRRGVVAFLGSSGAGKSTLCAELLRRPGCRLVADDGVAVREEGPAEWHASVGPPLLKLWPSALEGRMGIAPGPLPRVQREVEKRLLRSAPEGEEGEPAGLRLVGLYLLNRRAERSGSVTLERCSARESLIRLVESGVASAPAQALGLAASRFARLARLAEALPFERLSYPSGPDVADEILARIGEESEGVSSTFYTIR